jgi:hypothetical protein
VTVDANLPTNDFSVSNQGAVSGGNFTSVLTDDPGVAGAANPTVTAVVHPPTVSKAFGANSVVANGTTTLTLTIGNANPATNLTNISVTDNLVSGLVVATPNALVNNCGGTVSAVAGASVVSVSGLSRNANTSCTIVVDVTGTTAGAKPNTTGSIGSLQGGTGLTSNTAILTVLAPPTAANVPVAGRLLTGDGRGVFNAEVLLTGADGQSRTARTNQFGYFRFNEVAAGQTYAISVRHKRYAFAAQVISIHDEAAEIVLVAEP